jgi:IS30 family transposase
MAVVALGAHEREEIRVGIEAEESLSDIARELGRSVSTISREVARNGGRAHYRAELAQRRCDKQRRRARLTKFERCEELADHVEQRLVHKDSPTTIAIELARAGGVNGLTVSAETIYRAVYAQGRQGLAPGLGRHLHRKRRARKRRCRGGTPKKASPLGQFTLIHERGAPANERSEVGHFEGDLIIGANNRSAIVTLIDRTSRFNLIGDLPGSHDATAVLSCLIELLERVPASLRKTLCWDQGREMALHQELSAAVDIDVFFADPHSPWQRPTNENFNGLLRRYVGKATDLSVFTQKDLDVISHRINTMPRRLFKWESALDRYTAAVVALTA